MDKISTIKKNILYFIENQGFKKEDFFNKIGVSYSNFKGKSLNSEISADKLVTILTMFPELNSDWLLTGKGKMLKENETIYQLNEPEDFYKKNDNLIVAKQEIIDILKREVEDLRSDKELLKKIIEVKL
jgi:hypothetical protein